ncbi:hypothetical protein FRZ67_20070 [Panacibacter ginsenosidivorans]|uniref:Uncharacterized protein n=1 Tax=Panacibacter ginsenosidivorans TaxID=1813871 RepID=A0A5B8VEK2_9BACT|nr:hypothetical protein [Panacibacter ginsenosidivorans]QEC69485.1 hypothetical protein FRZ67_20070 [Panacibacter ginsenosidivorans]
MAQNPQKLTIDSVSEWSKWITGLSMFSLSGCVSVLLTKGVAAANITNMKLAIAFFLLTILTSWFIQIFAAELKQHIPQQLDAAAAINIFSFSTAKRWFKRFVFAEMFFFLLSLLFLLIWIWNLPAKAPTPAATSQIEVIIYQDYLVA